MSLNRMTPSGLKLRQGCMGWEEVVGVCKVGCVGGCVGCWRCVSKRSQTPQASTPQGPTALCVVSGHVSLPSFKPATAD